MNKSTILQDAAKYNIWQEHYQDRQFYCIPARETPKLGAYKYAKYMWRAVNLPNAFVDSDESTFHLYSLGHLPSWLYSINDLTDDSWYPVETFTNSNNTTIDVTAFNGCIVPRSLCYIRQTSQGYFLLAIKRDNTISLGIEVREDSYGVTFNSPYTLDRNGISVRFYTNAIQQSPDWRGSVSNQTTTVKSMSVRLNNPSDLSAFIAQTAAFESGYNGVGQGVYFQDGFLIPKPNGWISDYAGTLLSYHFDETIREIQRYPLSLLPTFKSTVDLRTDKYLLLGPTDSRLIDYKDDCDFYLINRGIGQNYKGIVLDQMKHGMVRQVTHNAWSVRADIITDLRARHPEMTDLQNLEILVVVRNGGMRHNLAFQSNRIEDLYRLTRDEIISTMTQVNSNVDFWTAASLEASAYMQLMDADMTGLTSDLIEAAYGYNAATLAVERSIYQVTDNHVTLAPAFSISTKRNDPNGDMSLNDRVFFWYDVNGLLLGYTTDRSNIAKIGVPQVYRNRASTVEVFLGTVENGLSTTAIVRNKTTVPDPTYGFYGYRTYVCTQDVSGADEKWQDVTDEPFSQYVIPADGSTPYVQWDQDLLNKYGFIPLTKFASNIHVRTFNFNMAACSGAISFTLSTLQDGYIYPVGPRPGNIDVFMGGESLIEGIDFYFGAGDQIVITKQVQSNSIDVLVRFYGYCDPVDMSSLTLLDSGFVKNGVISRNEVFNCYRDRDIRIVVNGQLYRKDQVVFAEDEVSGNPNNLLQDGYPYSVYAYQPCVEPYTNQSTPVYQRQSRQIDKTVESFLTPRLPETESYNQYIQGGLWNLYSPILSTIAYYLQSGEIDPSLLTNAMTDKLVGDLFNPIAVMYQDFDPLKVGFDDRYCRVNALAFDQVMELTLEQYNALEIYNRVFLGDIVNLSTSFKIKVGN